MSSYFITATGTGIGKTFTTCALLHAAKGKAQGYKPVIAGYDSADSGNDTALIAAYGQRPRDEISPWRFNAALSPDMAARREGRSLPLNELVDWTMQVAAKPGLNLIETVGGVMVPLNEVHTTRDWLEAVNIPLVLVTGSYLGALSHTFTALESLRAAKLKVTALIVNGSPSSPVDLQETAASIANHARDIPLILAQPRVSSPSEATVIHSLLEHLA